MVLVGEVALELAVRPPDMLEQAVTSATSATVRMNLDMLVLC
jgi:hypothetical protein